MVVDELRSIVVSMLFEQSKEARDKRGLMFNAFSWLLLTSMCSRAFSPVRSMDIIKLPSHIMVVRFLKALTPSKEDIPAWLTVNADIDSASLT